MLIWVAALHCEAKPVIDFFRLKKSHDHHAFDIYQKDNMCCIVSGIGKLNSAAATAWVAALHRQSRSIAWINIGTAGSESYAIGSAWSINKISDIESGHRYYPVPLVNSQLPTEHCQTHNQPDNQYDSQSLSDMEASAFFGTATRFSSGELIHCIKVVSDNSETPCSRDKNEVSQLIQQNMKAISEFSQALTELNQQIAQMGISETDWQRFLAQAHFSQTQKTQLKSCLRFLLSQGDSIDSLMSVVSAGTSISASKKASSNSNSQSILSCLTQRRIDFSRNL
jgi:adenosylhomocysteine nucleosidase